MATLGEVIRKSAAYLAGRGVDSPALSARLMAGKALGLDQAALAREAEREVTAGETALVEKLVRRRGEGEPAAYILGEKEFYGLSMLVGPEVLVPRPETELLIDTARKLFEPEREFLFADLGTGSGCLAVAMAVNFPYALGLALDRSPEALAVAGKNVLRHGVHGRLLAVLADFTRPFAAPESLDLILANPPYVSDEEYERLSAEVRRYEPAMALRGGACGLDPGAGLLERAVTALRPGGAVVMEIGETQAEDFRSLIPAFAPAFKKVEILKDLSQRDRAILAIKSR